MDRNIIEIFETIDDVIVNGSDNIGTVNRIDELFAKVQRLIEDSESELNEYEYNQFKYQFHMKKASYLKLIGKIAESEKEEKLVPRYAKKLQSTENETETMAIVTFDSAQLSFSTLLQTLPKSVLETIQYDVRDIWNKLRCHPESYSFDTIVNELNDLINKFLVDNVELFEQYNELDKQSSQIRFNLNVLKSQILSNSDNAEDTEAGPTSTTPSGSSPSSMWDNELLSIIEKLDLVIFNCLYEYRCTFGQFLLSQKHKMNELIFENIPLTEERINSHARKLAKLFHPDKIERFEDLANFRELFECIITVKNNLIDHLMQRAKIHGLVPMYKEEGCELWKIARDYSRAKNGKWTKLCHLKEDDLKNLTMNELLAYQKQYALLAYEKYRAAALALGHEENAEERCELRRMMAITLYTAEENLAAQTYVIAAMHILLNDVVTPNQSKEFNELQELLNKIAGTTSSTKISDVTTSPALTQTARSISLVVNNESNSSLVQKKALIKNALKAIMFQQYLIRSKETEVQTSQELILHAKRKAFQHKKNGILLGAGGVMAGVGVISTYGTILIATGSAAAFLTGPVGIAVGIIGGISLGAGSLLLSSKLIKRSRNQFQEPKIREILNKNFSKALEYYKEQNYADFLELLATKYFDDRTIISIESDATDHEVKIQVEPKKISQTLLKHDFRPDGIAYLLILIGEALLKKPQLLKHKGNFRQPTQSSLNELAIQCFSEVYQATSSLQTKAKELDDEVKRKQLERHMTTEDFLSNFLWKLKASHSSYKYSIPKEYFTAALDTPFTSRLEELSNIARLNYVIAQIIIGGTDNFQRSQQMISDIKERRRAMNKNNQFFMISETLEQALDDLLLAFGFFPQSIVDEDFLALENNIILENIKTVIIDRIPITCERVKAVKYAPKLFNDLSELSSEGNLIFHQENFVKIVEDIYEKDFDPTLKATIEQILKIDGNDNINNWVNDHLYAQKWILSAIHLPLLSKIFNIQIHPCVVKKHETYGHVFIPNEKLAIEQDTLRVFAVLNEHRQQQIIGLFTACDLRVNYLYNQLNLTDIKEVKIDIIHKIASYYRIKAEAYETIHHLKALRQWHLAMENYCHILKLSDSNDLKAILGYGRCLIMLSKFKRAEEFLHKKIATQQNSMTAEGWCLLGVAKRKYYSYKEAKYFVQQALKQDPDYIDAKNELKIIHALQNETTEERIGVYQRMTTTYSNRRQDKNYNILSIDGGGIRGIMPAIWIAEIERRTNRCAASLFNMMAGTSAGAIITAGLSLPDTDEPLKPRYKAADIVQLYRADSSKVFKKPSNPFYNLRRTLSQEAKYIDQGRVDLFGQYFGNTYISKALTDLIIPAVQSGSKTTHLFNRYDSLNDKKEDHQIHEILMCTTATPTYFQPYKLGSRSFVDGGVQMNNPTMAAYTEALRYGTPKENIFILSLGTGDYVPDPMNPDAYRHLLFYATHYREVLNIVLDGPQSNTDLHLSSIMAKDKYHRWQVWLEKPIELDNHNETTIECLCNYARTFLEEMDAYDTSNRLGLLIDRLKGDEH